MKIQLWTIGKNHEAYVLQGVNDFTKRITKYYPVEWVILPPPRHGKEMPELEMKKKEGVAILELLKKEDWLVALEETGKPLSSVGLAAFLQTRANESTKSLVFLIGGSYGLDQAILSRANFKWSLSTLTFPHQLVRLILAEQLYRACSILRNEKYHHA